MEKENINEILRKKLAKKESIYDIVCDMPVEVMRNINKDFLITVIKEQQFKIGELEPFRKEFMRQQNPNIFVSSVNFASMIMELKNKKEGYSEIELSFLKIYDEFVAIQEKSKLGFGVNANFSVFMGMISKNYDNLTDEEKMILILFLTFNDVFTALIQYDTYIESAIKTFEFVVGKAPKEDYENMPSNIEGPLKSLDIKLDFNTDIDCKGIIYQLFLPYLSKEIISVRKTENSEGDINEQVF